MMPIEKIAANGMTIEGLSDGQCEALELYIRLLSQKIEKDSNGNLIYHLMGQYGGGIIKTDFHDKKRVELSDEVSIGVVDSVRYLIKKENGNSN